MKNQKIFSLLCFIVMALGTVGSIVQTQNSFLDKILSSATPDAFAECSGGNLYNPSFCSLYTDTVTVDENPVSATHSQSLGFHFTDPNSSFGPTDPASAITLNLTADSQCRLGPSELSTATIIIPNTPTGILHSAFVQVTAVNDGISEASTHLCTIAYTAAFNGPGYPAGSGYVFTTDSVDVNVIDFTSSTSVASNYTNSPTLSENPNLATNVGSITENAIIANSTFNLGDTVTMTTDGQCFVAPNTTPSSYVLSYAQDLNTSLPVFSPNVTFGFPNITTSTTPSTSTNVVYVKAKTDSAIEGNHVCRITFVHDFPGRIGLNYTEFKDVPLVDYTPSFEAKAPDVLYEKPADATAQSSTGAIDIRLLDLPSDNVPVVATFTNLSPEVCEIVSTQLTFDQSNYNTKQAIEVKAVKDGIFQPQARKCDVKITFSSQSTVVNSVKKPKFILAKKNVMKKTAVEYNNLSYNVSINVLDADAPPTLIQTGKTNTWFAWFAGVVTLLSTVIISLDIHKTNQLLRKKVVEKKVIW
jgi:hypothetical protein